MDARIVSNQVINSLQISVLKEVPSGNFNPGVNFLLKNISDDDVEVTIIPAGQKDSIKTIRSNIAGGNYYLLFFCTYVTKLKPCILIIYTGL